MGSSRGVDAEKVQPHNKIATTATMLLSCKQTKRVDIRMQEDTFVFVPALAFCSGETKQRQGNPCHSE